MKQLSATLFFILSGLVVTLLTGSVPMTSEDKSVSVQLFFTSDMIGYLKPCG